MLLRVVSALPWPHGRITRGRIKGRVRFRQRKLSLEPLEDRRVLASLAGTVFFDGNDNGILDGHDFTLPAVEIRLSGTSVADEDIEQSLLTADDGTYLFSGLPAGEYQLAETQSEVLFDGRDTIGSQGGTADPTPGADLLSDIVLTADQNGTGNNFAESGLNFLLGKRAFLSSSDPISEIVRDIVRESGPASEGPVANPDFFETNEDTTLDEISGVLSNDSGQGTLQASLVEDTDDGDLELDPDGTFTFIPDDNFFGTDSFIYRASDDDTGVSDTTTATITVQPVNDPPSFELTQRHESVNEAGPQEVPGFAFDIEPGPDNESAQSVSFVTSNDNESLFAEDPEIAPDGTLTYTADANEFGDATVTVQAVDDGGTANGGENTSESQAFVISIAPNMAPNLTLPTPFDNPIVPVQRELGETISFTATVDDDGPAADLTFILDLDNSGIPAGAAMPLITSPPNNVPGGFFTWTPDVIGEFEITVIVIDAFGAADQETFVLGIDAP